MEFTFERTVKIVAILLIALVATQAVYTGLYLAEADIPRTALWGSEGLLFTLLAAFAGAAMIQAGRYAVGWSAIAFSAVLNVVQVGVGLTMFGPFRAAADNVDALAPVAAAVVAFSFLVYNAAKILLGLAALIFGVARMNAGAKLLGGAAALVGVVAMASNFAVMALGRDSIVPAPLAGASGVIATVLLALCLWNVLRDEG
jgi:hypothetical protein